MKEAVLNFSDVLFNWVLASSKEEENVTAPTLEYIATHGFPLVHLIMEKFKQYL